ncbi:MAG: hypothetical protein HY351_05345 [Candidatus Omnitrophica bacterium]|nr:hypothetical protein [Candidatus Omnitrophota bacterium]
MFRLLALLFIGCFIACKQAFACPLCKEALAKMGEVWAALGFNWSIYFMMSIPYLLVGGFIFALYLNYKKHHKS